jgi:hypothetical protein
MFPRKYVFDPETQPVLPVETTFWGLKPVEWITIVALIVGPIMAVCVQLWIQHYNKLKDQKLYVYAQLSSNRATWASQDFVRAMNLVDVVFYKNEQVREKRTKLMAHIKKTTTPEGAILPVDWDRAKDLFAEMLDLMGKELHYEFEHTEIKDSAYYPVAHETMDRAALELREKSMEVLNGTRGIPVIVYEAVRPAPQQAQQLPPPKP